MVLTPTDLMYEHVLDCVYTTVCTHKLQLYADWDYEPDRMLIVRQLLTCLPDVAQKHTSGAASRIDR